MSEKIYPLKLYLQQKTIIILLGSSFVLNVFSWLWLLIRIRPQKELIFLHYNILFGVDLIGEWWKVFYIPLVGLIIIFANALLGWLFFNSDKFIARLLNFVSLFCQIFLVIVSALLIFLNV